MKPVQADLVEAVVQILALAPVDVVVGVARGRVGGFPEAPAPAPAPAPTLALRTRLHHQVCIDVCARSCTCVCAFVFAFVCVRARVCVCMCVHASTFLAFDGCDWLVLVS